MRLSIIAVVLFAILIASVVITTGSKTQPTPELQDTRFEKWEERYSLKSIAQRARAKGQQQVYLPAPDFEYGDAINLEEALSYYSVIVGEPLEESTYAVGIDGIQTWYKFRIIEIVSQSDFICSNCSPVDPPDGLFPLSPNEFLVCKAGGTLLIDGIEVNMIDAEFPPFEKNQRYLLLASITPSGFARMGIGPTGVFKVSDEGLIDPINKKPHPIKDKIKNRFNSSLVELRESFRAPFKN